MPVRTKEFYEKMNRVMEKIAKTKLSENAGRYAWGLFRNSYGFGKYEVEIKGSKMAEITGMYESNVSDIQTKLEKRKIIYVNGRIKGFNINTDEWENLQLPVTFKNLQLPGRKTYSYQEEKLTATSNLSLVTKRKKSLKKDFYMKLTRKEIEKLELENWYRAVMWNYGKFGMEYIEQTIKKYDYNTRMSCWYIYQEAGNIRNKEAYFSKLLENYQ